MSARRGKNNARLRRRECNDRELNWTSDAGIPGGEDRRRRLGGHPRLGARSGREAVQARRRVAAEVFDEVTLEGRFGIVLSRLDGPTLLQLLRTRAMTPEQRHRVLQCCR